MAMDLTVDARYETWDDLLGYMDGSAAVIGEMMLPVLEPDDTGCRSAPRPRPRARLPAHQLPARRRRGPGPRSRLRAAGGPAPVRRRPARPACVTPEWRAADGASRSSATASSTAPPTTASRCCPARPPLRRDGPRAVRADPRPHRGRRLRRVRLLAPGAHVRRRRPWPRAWWCPRADAPACTPTAPRATRTTAPGCPTTRSCCSTTPAPPVGQAPSRSCTTTTPRCTWPSPVTSSTPPGACSSRPGREQAKLPRRRHQHRVRPPRPGEDLAEAVRRRARSELGVDVRDLRLVLPRLPLPRDDERPRRARAVPGVRRLRRRRPSTNRDPRRSTTPVGALGGLPLRTCSPGSHAVSPWCAEQVPPPRRAGARPARLARRRARRAAPAAALGPDAEAA